MAIVKRGCISSLWCQKSNLEIVITMPRRVSKQLGDSVTYRTIKAVIYGDIQNVQQFENSWLRFRQSQKPDKFFFIIFKEVRLSGMAKTMPQGTLYSPMPPPTQKKGTLLYNVHGIGLLGHNIAACSCILRFVFHPVILQDY